MRLYERPGERQGKKRKRQLRLGTARRGRQGSLLLMSDATPAPGMVVKQVQRWQSCVRLRGCSVLQPHPRLTRSHEPKWCETQGGCWPNMCTAGGVETVSWGWGASRGHCRHRAVKRKQKQSEWCTYKGDRGHTRGREGGTTEAGSSTHQTRPSTNRRNGSSVRARRHCWWARHRGYAAARRRAVSAGSRPCAARR